MSLRVRMLLSTVAALLLVAAALTGAALVSESEGRQRFTEASLDSVHALPQPAAGGAVWG